MNMIEELQKIKGNFSLYTAETINQTIQKCLAENSLESFLDAIEQCQFSQDELKQILNDEITINMDDFRMLTQKQNLVPDLKVTVVAKDVSELSLEELEKGNGKFSCAHISLDDQCLGIKNKAPYTLQEYELCQQRIDDLIKDVIVPPEGTPNREKIIWGQVTDFLASHMKINEEYERKIKAMMEKIHHFEEQHQNEDLQLNEDYVALLTEEQKMIDVHNYNMVGPLLLRQGNCSAFAETVRNVFSRFGIEVMNAKGLREDGHTGHSWNQIKLDGEWFNMDLAWERDSIIDKWDFEVNQQGFLLMNDEDFNDDMDWLGEFFEIEPREGHGVYSRERVCSKQCTRTIPCEEWIRYLEHEDVRGIPYHEWQKQGISLNSIQRAIQHKNKKMDQSSGFFIR